MLRSVAALILVLLSSPAVAASPTLTPMWTLSGLQDPESVALSEDGSFLYVSNVNGEGDVKDGNGYISKVSRDGQMLEAHWAVGMDGPKGLSVTPGRVWVADITALVEIEAATGKVLHRYEAPGARFLNDTAIDRRAGCLSPTPGRSGSTGWKTES